MIFKHYILLRAFKLSVLSSKIFQLQNGRQEKEHNGVSVEMGLGGHEWQKHKENGEMQGERQKKRSGIIALVSCC